MQSAPYSEDTNKAIRKIKENSVSFQYFFKETVLVIFLVGINFFEVHAKLLSQSVKHCTSCKEEIMLIRAHYYQPNQCVKKLYLLLKKTNQSICLPLASAMKDRSLKGFGNSLNNLDFVLALSFHALFQLSH